MHYANQGGVMQRSMDLEVSRFSFLFSSKQRLFLVALSCFSFPKIKKTQTIIKMSEIGMDIDFLLILLIPFLPSFTKELFLFPFPIK